MGGPGAPFACDSGYIVQVASELSQTDFEARIAQIRADGTLPADAKWTQTSTTCAIYTGTANAFVLYDGPFASPYAACATRLASPPDAFIRTTTPGPMGFISCMCPASASVLPAITIPGQTGVWIGELQWVLRHLSYQVADIDGPPSGWGTFTSGTIAAVVQFQTDQDLPVTGEVDAATWSALHTTTC